MFESLSAKFSNVFSSLRNKGRLKSSDLEEIAAEIKSALLDSDVALEVAEKFSREIVSNTTPHLDEVNKSTNRSEEHTSELQSH